MGRAEPGAYIQLSRQREESRPVDHRHPEKHCVCRPCFRAARYGACERRGRDVRPEVSTGAVCPAHALSGLPPFSLVSNGIHTEGLPSLASCATWDTASSLLLLF